MWDRGIGKDLGLSFKKLGVSCCHSVVICKEVEM